MIETIKGRFKRTLRVRYPVETGSLVIRTELDWDRDIQPIEVSSDGTTATFEVEAQQRFIYFKTCLIRNGSLYWSNGPNNLVIMAGQDDHVVYPYFFSDPRGHFLPLVEIESTILGRHHRLRCYLPPGYEENTLARYPLAYMQDGQNLFFPEEAFRGQHWRVERNQSSPARNAGGRRSDHRRRLLWRTP